VKIERKLVDDCVHCGFCLPTCPTYVSWGEEMDSPRGRIYLMKSLLEGTVTLSETVIEHFDRCLGCMACVTACPSGVKYGALIIQTRAEVERARQNFGERVFRSTIFALFPHPTRLRAMVALQLLYVGSGLRWLAHALGLMKLLPRRVANLESLMPPVNAKNLTAKLPAFTPAQGTRRVRVALLQGCVQRVYFPDVNEATIRVLAAEGCDVVVPPDLGCCGALSEHAGRDDESRRYARAAIAELEKANVDAVIVNAAGCGSSMKYWGHLLHDDPEWAERAAAMAKKVKDATEFLAALPPVAKRNPLDVKITYHDACHLLHAQQIRLQPRALLAAIPGVQVGDVPDADQCCGSAGIYNLVEPESAREVGERKVDNILSVAPELLVTANPGCTLQIEKILRDRGKHVRTAHVMEVLDASIRGVELPES
jgi:glycolate dehydrogenase iron-sulfur subunit